MTAMAKENKAFEELFSGPTVEIPMLTSGEVTAILDIKMWRLERFLENYPLKAGRPGKGQGSRRLFSSDDVRRLFIAKWLLDDGFQPTLVAEILGELNDRHFTEYDSEGNELSLSLVLKRDAKSEQRTSVIIASQSGRAPVTKDSYYVLEFDPLVAEVDQRITKALQRRAKR